MASSDDKTYSRIVGIKNEKSRTKLNLVCDLDECLIRTMPDNTEAVKKKIQADPKYIAARQRIFTLELRDVMGDRGKGRIDEYWGVKRPHLDDFLLFAFEYFHTVSVWSAGQRGYVDAVVDKIFYDFPVPHVVMNHDDVVYLPSGNYYKPLKKVYSLDPETFKESNTLLIDNRYDNFLDNPSNAIHIPDYRPSANPSSIMNDDICLQQFQQWLLKSEVVKAKDIRPIPKVSIFKTPLKSEDEIRLTSPTGTLVPLFRKPMPVPERPMVALPVK